MGGLNHPTICWRDNTAGHNNTAGGSWTVLMFWFRLQSATKAPRGRPSPCWGAEENGKKQGENWWVGIRAV